MGNKISNILANKKFAVFASFLGLYLFTTGSAWAIFTYLKDDSGSGANVPGMKTDASGKRVVDESLPKTEECPINGKMFSKPVREVWEKRRPVAAMVENNLDARPLSGISKADVVYEAVAEGGITRFMGVFYCGASAQDMELAVIRSARVYYINWAQEYGNQPIFLHWGGANSICSTCPGGVKPRADIDPRVDAYKYLNKIGWFGGTAGNDFNAGHNIGVPAVMRVTDRLKKGQPAAAEHQPVAFMDEVFNEAAERGFVYKDKSGAAWDKNFVSWKFADDKKLSSPTASKISFYFWQGKPDYDVVWDYDAASNSYKRANGGQPFVDWYFNKEQITAKNVVVQFVTEEREVDREHHTFIQTTGKGDALIFQNGDVIKGTWQKTKAEDRTKFLDADGKEIIFVRGEIWIAAVKKGNSVEY